MNKLVTTDSFDYGSSYPDRMVTLLKVSSKGVEKQQLVKQAAVLTQEIDDVRPEHGKSTLHVIAMGASEDYGPNKNADGYKRAMLERDHPTFVSDGHVYKEHVNDDPKKASGTVKAAAYNPVMKRVELLISVDNDKWDGELTKLASGDDITVSMSCQVPYDVCSICDNKAKNRREYCDHMKKYAGCQLDDGRTVYVDNPFGRFFDISGVKNRADRIAFVLNKVASHGPVTTGAELYEMTRGVLAPVKPSARAWSKRAVLSKVAEIEKQVEGIIHGAHKDNPVMELSSAFSSDTGVNDKDADELSREAKKDLGKVLQSCGDARISLNLRDFAKIVLGNDDASTIKAAGQALPGVFCRALAEGGDELCEDGAYDCDGSGLSSKFASVLQRVRAAASLEDEPVAARSLAVTIHGGSVPRVKKASAAIVTPQSMLVAKEYAKYKLSFFEKCANDGRGVAPMFYWLGVLQNYIGD